MYANKSKLNDISMQMLANMLNQEDFMPQEEVLLKHVELAMHDLPPNANLSAFQELVSGLQIVQRTDAEHFSILMGNITKKIKSKIDQYVPVIEAHDSLETRDVKQRQALAHRIFPADAITNYEHVSRFAPDNWYGSVALHEQADKDESDAGHGNQRLFQTNTHAGVNTIEDAR